MKSVRESAREVPVLASPGAVRRLDRDLPRVHRRLRCARPSDHRSLLRDPLPVARAEEGGQPPRRRSVHRGRRHFPCVGAEHDVLRGDRAGRRGGSGHLDPGRGDDGQRRHCFASSGAAPAGRTPSLSRSPRRQDCQDAMEKRNLILLLGGLAGSPPSHHWRRRDRATMRQPRAASHAVSLSAPRSAVPSFVISTTYAASVVGPEHAEWERADGSVPTRIACGARRAR